MKKQRDLTNSWVTMKPRFARWHINHLNEVYGDWDETEINSVDIEIQLYLMCLMGIPVKGFVKGRGIDCWRVYFHESDLHMDAHIDEKDLKVTRLWLR